MRERLFLILYKAKWDIAEREGSWKELVLSAWTDLFRAVFSSFDLIAGWLFPAARQGRRDENMFPAFGHKCPSVPGMTSSVFIFLSLQLTQMLRLETPGLLASSGTACDGPRDKTGYSTWNCFSFQQTVLSICIPGSQNPRGKALESTATQRGRRQRCEQPGDTASPLVYLTSKRRKPFRQKSKPHQNRTKGKLGFGLLY